MDFSLVYVTTESKKEAQAIARALLEARLIACANIIEPMQSLYWWEGKIEESDETVLIVKTRAAHLPALMTRVKEMHSYDCPCIVALPITDGSKDYLTWLARETA